ncbi:MULTISPECIES: thiamine phosphate synthase [unclassified Burkholderia]|uniref:thiamine phosphate synthase n=1 Tax=unclassified Burkholderia TaxID=2613784 RepID=UPI00141F236C|nr:MULTISPECIES: thiamine phosphate synthase [unclassified Burkholderia]NIE86127.1 thiamine phosphate synthase [Burkholderia sp. Tr-860]NIF64511.1 thiamine phosphate synthase [Burkholderia sp. Cy-647]NIF99755.1 thiamine phosphate synthase [Burkholderia sp. Ax-1720]
MSSSEAAARPALPAVYLITPEPASATTDALDAFAARLEAAFANGIALLQLRVKSLDAKTYAALAARVIELAHAADARVICNGAITPAAALALGADGVHLSEASLFAASSRPVAREVLLSAACHDAASLRQARRIGADLVTLSPVKPTLTHPGAPALGWHGFAQCIAQAGAAIESAAPPPARPAVYALGGMTCEDLPDARTHGAHGVAGIRGFGVF